MRTTQSLFFITFTFLLLSCVQNTENKKNSSDEKHNGTYNGNNTDGKEDFTAFLDSFNNEEIFQMKRIKFPIPVTAPNTDHEGMAPKTDTISRYDWETLDLTYDSTFATREYDRYYQTVIFRKDTAVVEVRGIDNGIYADYYFALFDKKWFLVGLKEMSF